MALRLVRSSAGGAIAVSAVSWVSEYSASKVTGRVMSPSASMSSSSLHRYIASLDAPFIQQQRYAFSTKKAATTPRAKTVAKTSASAEKEAVVAATVSEPQSFLQWYEGHLQATPVRTKMVTGSILWGVGDAVAQIVPQLASGKDGKIHGSSMAYDVARTGRAAVFGFAFHAPTSHLHFNFLEWLTVRTGVTGLGIPVFKAFMEQFVYWSWLSNSMYHGCMGAMQGMSPTQIYERISDVLWETQKAQWVFWIPVQLLNFRLVPVRHQLNVVLLTSIVWTALLSAWYPPEDDSNSGTQEDEKEAKT